MNRCVVDDRGHRVLACGQLASTTLDIGMSIGRADDPWLKKLGSCLALLCVLGVLAYTFLIISSLSQSIGCCAAPFAAASMLLIWLAVQRVVSRRADEEALERNLPHYRAEHPDQCPACDTPFDDARDKTIADDGCAVCSQCGGAWFVLN